MRSMNAIRLQLTLTFAALAGCGGSSGGGPAAGAPEIEVFTQNALATTAIDVAMGVIAQGQFVAVPVFVRNLGTAPLSITGPIGITPTNCTATLRDAPPASVAVGDTGVFTVLVKAQAAGNPSVALVIPNDDANEGPFPFSFSFTLNTATHCTYTANVAGVQNLYASAFPGAPATTVVNGVVALGANGVGQSFHLVDRTLYTCQFAVAGDTDILMRGLGAGLPAAETNLTSALSTPTGVFGQILFAAGDDLVFTYNTGVPGTPTRLMSIDINGAVAALPVQLTGPVPLGAPVGVTAVSVSPRKDEVAFLGDLTTAGTQELFLVAVAGGPRAPLSAALPVGRSIDPSSIRWIPDQSGVLYETRDTATSQQRLLHLVFGATVTTLNGPVAVGRTGVIPGRTRVSANGTHIYFLTDEDNATGKRDLKVVSLIGNTVSAAGTLNAAVPGTTGVGSFGTDFTGTKALFIADSGANQEPELWQSLVAGNVPTTTKIVPTPAANRAVSFDGDRGILSSSVAWCTQNDVSAGRPELFFIDWSTAVPTLTRVIDNTVFTGGNGIQDLAQVFPQPDFHVALISNQGNATAMSVFGASLSATPGAVRLQARTTAGPPTVLGLRVAYEADNGSVPQDAFCNLITGGAEIQMGTSSSLVGSPILFSESRGFWHTFTPNLFNSSTTAAGTQQDTDAIGGSDMGSVRTGNEPRP